MSGLDRLEVDPQAIITFTLLTDLLRIREQPAGLTTEALAAAMVDAIGQLEAITRQSPRNQSPTP
jgi:hypothetical protein